MFWLRWKTFSDVHRAMSAGRRSTIAFQISRCVSSAA